MTGRIGIAVGCLAWAGFALAASPEMAGTVAVAPYGEVSAKVTSFGLAIGNPIVPTLLMAGLQRNVSSTYGSFRTDAPFYVISYAGAPGRTDTAVVYPAVDRIARMALANPGSEREAADVLSLMPCEKHPRGGKVVFAADGKYATFAPTVALARQAWADRPARPPKGMPLAAVSLHPAGVRSVCAAGAAAGLTNVFGTVRGMTRLDLALDFTERGLVLAFTGTCGKPAGAAFAARLERELLAAFRTAGGGALSVLPEVKVTAVGKSGVAGEVVFTRDRLAALGKDFNSFVAAQMMGALKDETKDRKNKDGSAKGAAKGKDKTK